MVIKYLYSEGLMANIYGYLRINKNVSFSKEILNEIDIAIFTILSYVDWLGIVCGKGAQIKITVKDACAKYLSIKNAETVNNSSDTYKVDKMIKMLLDNKRFGEVTMCLFEQNTDYEAGRQFAAITFCISDNEPVNIVAFRGTDDTVIGWKENFDLCYMKYIPSQKSSAKYLKKALKKLPGKFIVCGHSKGGNLAVFAMTKVMFWNVERINKIYNFDGPGFEFSITNKKMFKRSEKKVVNYIPQESIIGMMLKPIGIRHVVQSKGRGFKQHDIFSWKIDKNEFLRGELTDLSKLTDFILSDWLDDISIEDRENFVTSIFDLLGAKDGKTFEKEPFSNMKLIIDLMQKYSKMDDETKELINKIMSNLREHTEARIKSNIKSKMTFSTEQ